MKKYQHKKTQVIAKQVGPNYYRILTGDVKYSTDIPKQLIENSSDWEELLATSRRIIFMSDDKIPVREGDKPWFVNRKLELHHWTEGVQAFIPRKGYRYFMKEETARQYIEFQKKYTEKFISRKDVIETFNAYTKGTYSNVEREIIASFANHLINNVQ